MAAGRWILSAGPLRMLRLARAQADMASYLEHKVESEAQKGVELAQIRSGTLSAVERNSAAGLVFYAAALRRLTEIDVAIASNEQVRRELANKLLQARKRQEGLMRRAEELQEKRERKATDEEAREVGLAMADKATGKHDVMK